MKKIMFMTGLLVTCLYLESCSKVQNNNPGVEKLSNDIVIEWNEIAYEAFGGKAYLNSLMASRVNAMTHIAMHDALNAVYPLYSTYVFTEKDADADPIAAAASAAHTVLVHEIPDKTAFLDSSLQISLARIEDSETKNAGILLGQKAGQAIINVRSNDGSAGDPISAVPEAGMPGAYQAVPPFEFIFAPFWKDMKPFGIQSPDQFRAKPHPSVNSSEYAEDYHEVKEFGRLKGSAQSEDQFEMANFWYEFSEAGWNRVARVAAESKNLNLYETARLFALVDIAMADAYIAGWDSKFHYNLWRPYTAIHNAHADNNDYTEADVQWEPVLPTPPVQDYPSTHSALGNAAATVLGTILGEQTAFTFGSPTAIAGKIRNFTGFKQAADENANSRIQAGIHFRFACEAGQEMGDKIGLYVVENYLKPVK